MSGNVKRPQPIAEDLKDWRGGSDTSISFEGLTGHVAFDQRGYRKNYKLDIVGVSLDKGPHKSGEWFSEMGLRKEASEPWRKPRNHTVPKRVKVVSSILTKPFLMRKKHQDPSGPTLDGE